MKPRTKTMKPVVRHIWFVSRFARSFVGFDFSDLVLKVETRATIFQMWFIRAINYFFRFLFIFLDLFVIIHFRT